MDDKQRTQTTSFVAPGAQLQPGTALAVRVEPDKVLRDVVASQGEMYGAYLRTVSPVIDQTPADHEDGRKTGGASRDELIARNRRFYVTSAVIVIVWGFLAWGLVNLAGLAGYIGASWTWPTWFALAGAGALVAIRSVHAHELRLTPEGLENNRIESDYAIAELDAQSRGAIARAVAHAIVTDAEAKAEATIAAAEARSATVARLAMCAPRRRPALTGPLDEPSDVVYAASTTAITAPDPLFDTVAGFVASLYDETAPDAPAMVNPNGIIVATVPWSLRGNLEAADRERVTRIMTELTPPLIFFDDKVRRYRIDRDAYSRRAALGAVRCQWRA